MRASQTSAIERGRGLGRLLIASLISFFGLPAFAATYYVATTGDDLNAGTLSTPWATIQKAANTMVAGDSVLIREGTYWETVDPLNAGTPGNEIVYSAYPGEVVIIDPADTTNSGMAIRLLDWRPLNHLRFVGLTLRNAGGANFYARGLSPGGEKSHITLDGLTVENSYAGVYIRDGVTDVQILNCEMSANQHNIYLSDGIRDVLIDNNHLHDTQYHEPLDFWGDNIHVTRSPGGPKNVGITITDNHVHHAVTQGISIWHCDDVLIRDNHCHDNGATGIQIESDGTLTDLTQRVVVEGNLCEDNSQTYQAETGIWIDDSDYVIVQNNITRGNEIGLQITGSYHVIARFNESYENNHPVFINATGTTVRASTQRQGGGDDAIVHNTFYRNSMGSQRGQVTLGYSIPAVERVRVKNNVSSDGLGVVHLFIQGLTHTLDYNDYHEPGGQPLVFWQTVTTTWPFYLSTSGQDANSITDDPQFLDAAAGNFALDPSSPCVDAGGFLTTTTSTGSGTIVPVADACYFSDGIGLIAGDAVQIGLNETAIVIGVDYAANVLTLDRALNWTAGDGVGYPYEGVAPDMGAHEVSLATHVPNSPVTNASLAQNFPNPFNPTTTIFFSLQSAGRAEVLVYDVSGRIVRRLVRRNMPAGEHWTIWDGRGDRGEELASGVYFYELWVDARRIKARKALLLK